MENYDDSPPPLPAKFRIGMRDSAFIQTNGTRVKIQINPPASKSSPSVKININNTFKECANCANYFSGQSSPSDNPDSGTCSDIEGNTPPPLPKIHSVTYADSTSDEDRDSISSEYGSEKATIAPAMMKCPANETDRFLNFHMRETDFEKAKEDIASREEVPETIRSARGTIRGVKNRVRAGIATFLQINNVKSWQEKEAGKVVVYSTTTGIVRETYHRCLKVKQILRTHLVKFEEKDVFMSRELQKEIKERMGTQDIVVPQVFVEGIHIGDAEVIDRLNESGELRNIMKPYRSADACNTCQVCGGYRLLPCNICNGSKKSVHRNHFSVELVTLKCMNCDEVGLIKCFAC